MDTEGCREQPHNGSTSLANGNPSPLTSGRRDSTVFPVAYLESSKPSEKERDRPGVVPEKVKSLARRTDGWRDRETVESDRSQDDSGASGVGVAPDGSGISRRGGVLLNTDGSRGDSGGVEELDDNSPRLSLASNPTPGETGLVSQPDRGCEE